MLNLHKPHGHENSQLRNHFDNEVDMVNSPPHYKKLACGLESIEIAHHLDFCLGNVFKYVVRHKHKNGRQDIQKAIKYIDFKIKLDKRTGKHSNRKYYSNKPYPRPVDDIVDEFPHLLKSCLTLILDYPFFGRYLEDLESAKGFLTQYLESYED